MEKSGQETKNLEDSLNPYKLNYACFQKLAGVGTLPARHEGAAHSCGVGVLWLTVKLGERHRFCSRFSHLQIFVQFFTFLFNFPEFPSFSAFLFLLLFHNHFLGETFGILLKLAIQPWWFTSFYPVMPPSTTLRSYLLFWALWVLGGGTQGFHSLPCHSTTSVLGTQEELSEEY